MRGYDLKTDFSMEVHRIMFGKAYDRNVQAVFTVMSEEIAFYYHRLCSLYMYSLYQGRELIKMICRCAFNDSLLTETEAIVIMETCLDPALDNLLLEVNYNESW